MNSYNMSNIQKKQTLPALTADQMIWINSSILPTTIFLKNATEFDDQWLSVDGNWSFRYSGEDKNIPFEHGKHFNKLSQEVIKLVKVISIEYIKENSASVVSQFAKYLAITFSQIKVITRETLLSKLRSIISKPDRNHSDIHQFYCTLFGLRILERKEFFLSTDKKADLEELLLEVPRPRSGNWGIYQDLDNVIPSEVCHMIENGIQRWASKLTPQLKNKKDQVAHLNKIKRLINIDKLRDCVITGIIYYVGMRPVQLGKTAYKDIVIDTQNEHGNRFSILVPYAKKSKFTIDRIRVAIPDELGKLILLYKRLKGLTDGDSLLPKRSTSIKPVNDAIKNILFIFSPDEIKKAVAEENYKLPIYTSTLFRHNVGHSMAMYGASAIEIAYILGQSSTVVAERYIAATPDIADIREHALGRNPVFKNMLILMMTGDVVHSSKWKGRKVACTIGVKLHSQMGGCSYEESVCPFSQGRACYGCLYFRPFSDGHHEAVLNSFNDEIDSIRNIADDTNTINHPLLVELTRRKQHVMQVIARIRIIEKKKEQQDE
ncbi:site-specific integrase [Photobacterium kishitanii]|uniref:site-specific integrase n=1 Tax=Photobacterium kishitanii TaxID=318456 RepID=UPI0015E658EB|nr:site-specific integrase [Photobacterium kishitanii]